MRWIHGSRRVDEHLYCEQRSTHMRLQLLKGDCHSTGSQSGHGVEQQGHQSERLVS
jgi:hypothetical protein